MLNARHNEMDNTNLGDSNANYHDWWWNCDNCTKNIKREARKEELYP